MKAFITDAELLELTKRQIRAKLPNVETYPDELIERAARVVIETTAAQRQKRGSDAE